MSDDELKRDFERYDTDGNGRIDESEFGSLVRALGVNMSDARIAVAFQAIDVDGSGTVEFGEFRGWWKKR
jgi:calmodulin